MRWKLGRTALLHFLLVSRIHLQGDAQSIGGTRNLVAALLNLTTDTIKAEYLQLFHHLWLEKRESVSWCLGSTESGAYKVLQRSIPTPLPDGLPFGDEFCSNTERISPYLCGVEQLNEYYKVG